MSVKHKWVLTEQRDATHLVDGSGRIELRKCQRCGLLWDLARRETDDGPEETHEFYDENENQVVEPCRTAANMPECDPTYRHDRRTRDKVEASVTPDKDKSAIEELWTPAQKWEAAKQIDRALDATSMPALFAVRAVMTTLQRCLPAPLHQVRYGGMRQVRNAPGVRYTLCKSPAVEADPFGDLVSTRLIQLWTDTWQRVLTHVKAAESPQKVRCMPQLLVTDVSPMVAIQLVVYVAELPDDATAAEAARCEATKRRWM